MPSRPLSSAASAIPKPCPSAPIRRSAGIRAPSSRICAVWLEFTAILRSGAAAESPAVDASASRQVMPRGPSSDVRVISA